MALTLAAPVIKGADFQEAFIDFANVAEIPIEQMSEIEARLVAATRETGKNKTELLQILSTYVGKGMDLDQALEAIRATGRASTATKAEVSDMSNAGFAVMDNLKVGASDLAGAFDVMALSGKEGSFELKDMARNFPELTAGAAALQMKGVPAVASLAAALQIAMKSAGSADQAANNMSNFLGKITSADAVKNFKEMGIDIEKELKNATEKGADPLLTALKLIEKATDGGDQFKMNQLFGDKQVKDFLLALIPNLEEYERIRDKAAGAEGVIDRDWINVTAGFKAQLKALVTEVDNLFSSSGALLPIAQELLTNITDIVRQVNDWTAANPELTDTIVKSLAALLAVNVASRFLAFGIAAVRGPLIRLFSAFLKFDKEGRNIATGWRLLSATAGLFGPALARLGAGAARAGAGIARLVGLSTRLRNAVSGLALLASISRGGAIGAGWTVLATAIGAVGSALATITAPAWAVIAALVAAGFAVWKFWDRISSFAAGFASVFAGVFSAAGSEIASFGSAFGNALLGIAGRFATFADKFVKFNAALFGIDPAAVERFKAAIADAFDFSGWIESARSALADFWSSLGSFFSAETLTDGEKENMYKAGQALGQRLVDGIKAFLLASVGVIGGLLTFDLKINWPDPPAWLKWLVERHQAAAGAAKELASSGVQSVRGWMFGDDEQPGAADKAEVFARDISGSGAGPRTRASADAGAASGGFLADAWAGLKSAVGLASDDLAAGGEQGGKAVADGGRDAAQALSGAAAEIRNAASGISTAMAVALRNAQASAAKREGGVASAISNARTGALAGGTE
nr:phage tail tape measure protein [Shinella kummerowiae]